MSRQKVLDFIEETDKSYFKSREISEQCDLSPKEIGPILKKMSGEHVEKWGYSRATTWKII